MSRRNIYILGETTYDILFKNNKPVDGVVGGSQLNTAVTLGRLSVPVHFISQVGTDLIGKAACHFLEDNGISTEFIVHHEYSTRLSAAFLNDQGDAEYSFYTNGVSSRLNLPWVKEDDIILFGSSFALRDDIRDPLMNFLNDARNKGAYIIYDPNFRKSYVSRLPAIKTFIEENIQVAHLVRGSDEDFQLIFGETESVSVYKQVCQKDSKILFITRNKKGVYAFVNGRNSYFEVPHIKSVSTIGAGDAFNAGIIFCLHSSNKQVKDFDTLSAHFWDYLVSTSIAFSQHTCMHNENYITKDFAQSFPDNPDLLTS